MAGVPWVVTSSIQQTAVTTGPKTMIQILAKTNHRAELDELTLGGRGANPVQTPILWEVLRQTDAGTGGTGQTLAKENPADPETLETSALVCAVTTAAWTTEPAAGAILRSIPVPATQPQILYFPTPLIITGTGTNRLAVRATADADTPVCVTARGRE